MPQDPLRMRDVVRSPRFEADMRGISGNAKKADEFLEGVELIISRNPQMGTCVGPASHVWFIPGHTVDVVIYYAFNDNYVYLLSACKTLPLET